LYPAKNLDLLTKSFFPRTHFLLFFLKSLR